MHIHGTEDKYHVYNGPGTIEGGLYIKEQWPVEKTIEFWVKNNQCGAQGDTVFIPDIDSDDHCTAQKITYTGGLNNAPVIFFKLVNGGHCWPGSPIGIGSWEDNRNMDFFASQEILNFFKNYVFLFFQ